MSNALYSDYEKWKSWSRDQFLKTSLQEEAYFAGEMSGIILKSKNVLEIGFGNGSFLGFARSRGANVSGTEIIEPALEFARAEGIDLLRADLADDSEYLKEKFDVVVAFDVLEHLTMSQIENLLSRVAVLLRLGGLFIARFPNGQSPLGRVWQHGDLTHRSTLSAMIFRQIIVGRSFVVVRAGDPYREYHGSVMRKLLDFIRYRMQDIFVKSIHFIFKFREPLGMNTVVVIKKT